jgi:protein-S-isoprenylcysteine O-methyltransferase Ste14
MNDVTGFFAPWLIYAWVLGLHLVLPAKHVRGYVRDPETGEPLRYRLNGLPVAAITVAAWSLACSRGWLAWDWLWVHRWASLAGACTLGVVFTLAIVLRAPSTGRSLVSDLYLGRLENPRGLGGRVDAKMFLYLAGATMLQLNLLSFAAHHLVAFPDSPSPGVLLHLVLFTWFVADYLFFEEVHLYTYDLFAERVGFKLGWGCLTFYPYFYAVGLWATADRPDPGTPTVLLVAYALVFFTGWSLARGANMQKFFFKLDPTHRFLGLVEPRTISDGQRVLLCSGFWGLSRHINYLGEILMATGLALVLGWPLAIAPWMYPLYYVLLLVPRERDDHRRCAEKYGALWQTYCERVPWRIVPRVY